MTFTNWSLPPNFHWLSLSLVPFVLSILVLLFGFWFAGKITGFFREMARKLFHNKAVQDSPVGMIFDSTEMLKGSGVVSTVLYWAVVLFFLSLAGDMLGITVFTSFVNMIVGYIPMVLSAVIVFLFGLVVSGIVERLVKKQFRKLAPQQSVLAGTLASYFTLSLFSLIAFSELGIASDFILILFAGFVLTTALSVGLAIGLGAKDVVRDLLLSMVSDEKDRRKQE